MGGSGEEAGGIGWVGGWIGGELGAREFAGRAGCKGAETKGGGDKILFTLEGGEAHDGTSRPCCSSLARAAKAAAFSLARGVV